MSNKICREIMSSRSQAHTSTAAITYRQYESFEAPATGYGLSIAHADNLAQFLLEQQNCLGAQETELLAADTVSPASVTALSSAESGAAADDKVLLGFHNLGHFLDWLDAVAAKRESV